MSFLDYSSCSDPDVLSLKLQDVGANLDQRPAANAIK